MQHRTMWVLFLAVAIACPVACSTDSEIESSISSDSTSHSMMGSLRFYGITKTVTTVTTVVHLHTKFVHQTCLSIPNGTPQCPVTTPAPTTTTTTTTTTPAPTTTTTTTAATNSTSNPPFKVVEGQFKPSVSSSITINKHTLPKLQLNLPQLIGGSGGNGGNGGFFGLFNSKPFNFTVSANMSASASSPGTTAGRRRRSEMLAESIQPSLVKTMDMTASPELSLREAIQQDVAVEASRAEEYHEYEIIGLMPHHFAERALPFFGGGRVTIVRVDPMTVTVSQTVTSKFPFDTPTDRVTLSYSGCVPTEVPDLPNC